MVNIIVTSACTIVFIFLYNLIRYSFMRVNCRNFIESEVRIALADSEKPVKRVGIISK
jgi:hypothetical protein